MSDRTAVVVGSGSGLGQVSALGLADAGAHVICADLNTEAAQATAQIIAERGDSAEAFTVDITDTSSVDALAQSFADAHALVITPGANVRKRLLDTTDDEFDRVIDINLKGTYRLMRAFGDNMRERGRGSIVTFASFRAEVVEPGQGLYAAAKAGVVQLTKTLASELGVVRRFASIRFCPARSTPRLPPRSNPTPNGGTRMPTRLQWADGVTCTKWQAPFCSWRLTRRRMSRVRPCW